MYNKIKKDLDSQFIIITLKNAKTTIINTETKYKH